MPTRVTNLRSGATRDQQQIVSSAPAANADPDLHDQNLAVSPEDDLDANRLGVDAPATMATEADPRPAGHPALLERQRSTHATVLAGTATTLPAELWLVIGLMAAAGVLAFVPVFQALPDTLRLFKYGAFGRAFGSLMLLVLAILGSFGAACLYLAQRLYKADRVGRGLSYVLLGSLGASILFGNDHAGSLIAVMLLCFGSLAILTLSPNVNGFFANTFLSDQPVPVVVARTLTAVWIGCVALIGIVFLTLGTLADKFIIVGAFTLLIGGAVAVFNRRLGVGDPIARIVISAGMGVFAILDLIIGESFIGLLLPVMIAGSIAGLLWIPLAARRFFGGPNLPPGEPASTAAMLVSAAVPSDVAVPDTDMTGGEPELHVDEERTAPTDLAHIAMLSDETAELHAVVASDLAIGAVSESTQVSLPAAPIAPTAHLSSPSASDLAETATFGQRLGARLIDGIILGALAFGAIFGAIRIAESRGRIGLTGLIVFVWLGMVILPVALVFFYRVFGEGSESGQTVGKAMVGIRVVREDTGGRAGFARATGRYIVTGLGNMLLFLGDLSMLWNDQRRTWSDRATGTRVVRRQAGHTGNALTPFFASLLLTAGFMAALGLAAGAGTGPFDNLGSSGGSSFPEGAPYNVTGPSAINPVVAAPAAPFIYDWSFTETTADGGSADVTLKVGTLAPFRTGARNGQASLGSACSGTASQDAAIPFELILRNSSNQQDTPSFEMDGIGANSFPALQGVTLDLEAAFSAGTECEGTSNGQSGTNIYATSALASDTQSVTYGFLIIHGYYGSAASPTLLDQAVLAISHAQTQNGQQVAITNGSGPGLADSGSAYQLALSANSPRV